MDLIDLRCFVHLGEERNFTRAAQAMNISQSALSKRISILEVGLGIQLVVRTSRTIELTQHGEELLKRAKLIIAEVDAARAAMKFRSTGVASSLRIGAPGTLASLVFPRLLKESRIRNPLVALHVTERRTPELIEAMEADALDLALIFSPYESTRKTVTPLLVVDLVVVLPEQHRLRNQSRVAIGDLKDEEFISLAEPGEPFSTLIGDMCIREGFVPSIALSGVDPRTAVDMVTEGMGVAIMSILSARIFDDQRAAVIPLDAADSAISVSLVTANENPATPAEADFRRSVLAWAAEYRNAIGA